MNEEIQITMGLNTSSFRSELEKAKQSASSFGSAVKEPLGSLRGQLTGLFAGLATIEAVKKVSEFAENIKRTAEITGLTTDAIQGFNYGVKQTGGNVEASDSALEKLNKTLGLALQGIPEGVKAFDELGISIIDSSGHARDAQDILREVADRIKNAKSETERAAIAFEAFGKAGQEMIPVLLNGADGLDRFTASASKLSEQNIEDILRFKKTMEDSGTTAQVWGGKVVGAIADIAHKAGLLFFGGTKAIADDDIDRLTGSGEYTRSGRKKADIVPDVTQTDAYKKALAKRDEAKWGVMGDSSPEAKYTALFIHASDLSKEIAAMQTDSVEKVNKQTELLKVQKELAEKKSELEKQDAEVAKHSTEEKVKAAREELEKKEKTLSMQKEYDTLERQKTHEQFEETQRGSQYASLEEVAQFRGGPFQHVAQAILRDNLDQKYARLKGNFGRADWDRRDANSRMDYLAAQGVIDPKDYEAHEAAQAAKNTDENIKTLLDKATNEGIKIIPVMAP